MTSSTRSRGTTLSADLPGQREGLLKAAKYIAAFLRRASPSEKDAAAWKIEVRGENVYLRNRALGAWATATNARHMTFGHRKAPWHNTNDRAPSRTDWDERALESAATTAAEKFADEVTAAIARSSDIWER